MSGTAPVKVELPDAHFGEVAEVLPDWRDQPDEGADDDEELPQTSPDVIAMLGFDPLDDSEDVIGDSWLSSKHPRGHLGNAGQFAKKGASAAHAAFHGAMKHAKGVVHRFGHEDYQALNAHFKHVKPAHRSAVSHHLRTMAKTVPQMLKSHAKEEREHMLHAVKALRSLTKGQKPTPEQFRGLRSVGLRALMTSASMALGDPTGTLGHLAAHFSQEIVQHVVIEHALKLFTGAGMAAIKGAVSSPQKDSDEESDEALAERFLLAVAQAVDDLDEKQARQLLQEFEQEEEDNAS